MDLSRRALTFGLIACALAGCGGGGGVGSSSNRTVDVRFFNGFDDQLSAGVRVSNQLVRPVVVYGATSPYGVAKEGGVDLRAVNSFGGTLATAATTFDPNGRYTILGFGPEGARGLVFANESSEQSSDRRRLNFRVIDLLEGSDVHYNSLRRDSNLVSVGSTTKTSGPVTGFVDVNSPGGNAGTFVFERHVTGDPTSAVVGAPIDVPIDTSAPVTLVLYGNPSDARYTLLKGVYTNL